jgi:hypothetical protein
MTGEGPWPAAVEQVARSDQPASGTQVISSPNEESDGANVRVESTGRSVGEAVAEVLALLGRRSLAGRGPGHGHGRC